MLTEHLLHLVALGETDFLAVIEVDHIRIPVAITVLAKQRSIGGHFYHITITLYIAEVDAFGKGTI